MTKMDILQNGPVRPVDGLEIADPSWGTPDGGSAVSRQGSLDTKLRKRRRTSQRDNVEFLGFLRRILVAIERRGVAMDPEDFAELLKLSGQVDQAVIGAAARMRVINGFTWQQIADAAGMTRQAAQQRWGKAVAELERSLSDE